MISEKEYNTLKSQYHIAVSRAQSLQEQNEKKAEQWKKREIAFKTTEKLIRELCENILAKDPKEMVLGTDYTWSSLPINEMINKSKDVFQQYIESRKDFMRRIMDLSEERRVMIEGLEDQISVLKSSPVSVTMTESELQEQINKQKVAPIPEQETPGQTNIQKITCEDMDENADENALFNSLVEADERMRVTPKSVPVTNNRKKIERKKKEKNKMIAHTVNLSEYEEKMGDISWMVMDIIGTEGKSIVSEIENSLFQKDPTIVASKLRTSINTLVNIGLLNREPVKIPIKGSLYVHQLTDMGSHLYKAKYGKAPVASEMDLIMAEHDNCTHGYSIKFLAEQLRESGVYEEVLDRNRKNPIQISEGCSYIPDIICIDKNHVKTYIEYECVNYNQTNFNAKCSKMCRVTSVLNFVVPNREAIEKIMKLIENWIDSRGPKALNHITIRVTSATQFNVKDLGNNRSWKIVYNLAKKKEPFVNF